MAAYEKEVLALLRDAGCRRKRPGKGDHEVWYSPINGRTFSVKAHRLRSRHTANAILKQAGLTKRF